MVSDSNLIIAAGPCSVESEYQLMKIAEAVKKVGGQYLRGGAWKPRTKGGDWEGLKEDGLKIFQKVADDFELGIVTEILGPAHADMTTRQAVEMFQEYDVDIFQIGARNAQNQELLNQLGDILSQPEYSNVGVLLKNGMNTTLKEWLGSASRLPHDQTMLAARGKNNETDVARNGQDITTIVEIVNNTPYPIIFDPSHIAGKREYVYGITMGAVAAGVDGLLVEVHHDPLEAKTDSAQAITPKQLEYLIESASRQRQLYLSQIHTKKKFATAELPRHADIYFKSADSALIEPLSEMQSVPYLDKTTDILTARVPVGILERFGRNGLALGELVELRTHSVKTEAIHVALPGGDKLRMSPYSEEALKFTGRAIDQTWKGTRIELVRGFPQDTVRDGFLTRDMKSDDVFHNRPLVIYRVAK